MARVGVVTTLRLPRGMSQPLRSFLDYHLAVGFKHVFLFFDDPDDESIHIAEQYAPEHVSVLRRGDELMREQAERCSQYTKLAQYIEEVPVRQMLNAELAMILAEERGLTWLLHIDIDELFFTEESDVSAHFAWLDSQGVYSMAYINHEGVPETLDVVDYFQEVTLFRRHFSALPMDAATREAVEFWRRRTNHGQYFLVYDNGKSACRVGVGAYPKDVHSWQLPAEHRARERTAIADARHLDPSKLLIVNDPCILHFVTCGLQWFLQKYRMLADFESAWFGGRLPIAPSFHLDARDAVLHKQEAKASAEQLYRQQVLFPATTGGELSGITSRHLEIGVLFRCSRHTLLIASRGASTFGGEVPRRAHETSDEPGISQQISNDDDGSSNSHSSSSSHPPSNLLASAAAAAATATATAEFDRAWIIAQVAQQYLVDR